MQQQPSVHRIRVPSGKFLWRLAGYRVPVHGRSLAAVLRAVGTTRPAASGPSGVAPADAAALQARDRDLKRLGLTDLVVSTALVIALVVSMASGSDASPIVGGLLLLWTAFTVIGWRFGWRHIARRSQPTAEQSMLSDPRPPILLLRSFADDEFVLRELDPLPLIFPTWSKFRLEEIIVEPLAARGPVVAIGRPGETVPQLGAARGYVSDEEWQATASDWMRRADLIVVMVGHTQGVRWELERIVAQDLLGKLLIVLPPRSVISNTALADRGARWTALMDGLGETHWAWALAKVDRDRLVAMHALDDGSLVVIETWRRHRRAYQRAMKLALFGMTRREGQKIAWIEK